MVSGFMARDKLRQYGIVVMAILLGGGFLLGPISSFANLGGSTNGNQNTGDQNQRPELPQSNFYRGSYNLTIREKAFFGASRDIVFLTVITGKDTGIDYQAIVKDFGGRIYISVVEESPALSSRLNFTDRPAAAVVGGQIQRTRRGAKVVPRIQRVEKVSRSGIVSASCGMLSSWNGVESLCYGTAG